MVWGDVCGYTWGPCGARLRIPLFNERLRQTYFGALNVLSGRVEIQRFAQANAKAMVNFLNGLLKRHSNANITICLDRAPYHRSKLVKQHVSKINQGLTKDKRRLALIWLAPNAPEENPMEEIWLYGKTAIRKNPNSQGEFEKVKEQFETNLRRKKFRFEKLRRFQKVLQIK